MPPSGDGMEINMFGKSKNGPSGISRFTATHGTSGTLSMLIFGGLLLVIFFVVRLTSGSPYVVMQRLRLWSCIPPVFFTTLLFTLWYLTIGCAFGLCLGSPCRGREAEKYKGGMLFVVLAVLELLWYPCFFVRAEIFFALLLSLLCVLFCVGVFLCFLKVSGLCAGVMLIHCLWLIYLTVICLIALFRM